MANYEDVTFLDSKVQKRGACKQAPNTENNFTREAVSAATRDLQPLGPLL